MVASSPNSMYWTRSPGDAPENLKGNLVGAVVLHAAIFGAIFGSALVLRHHGQSWGENRATAGAIEATMVSALPLPPRQKTLETGVLTSEKPSPAPTPAKEKTEPPPSPKDLLVQKKLEKPAKVAEKVTPEPPKRPQPVVPEPKKATTGETAGIRIPQATMQLKNGTASISVEDRTFGSRFAYYVNIVNRTVAQNWYTQEADPVASEGKKVVLVFDIDRAGTPSNVRVESRSGSASLDTSAVRALQRVEGFGPLPQGDHITVEYTFHYQQQ